MRVVSGLYHLGRRIMGIYGSFFDWLWRKLGAFWRCIRRLFIQAIRFSQRLSIVWRGNEESGPEINEENPRPVRGASPENVEANLREGRHEEVTKASKQSAESDAVDQEDEEDEFYCEYDSTWESEQSQEWTFRRARKSAASWKFRRFESAARDMQNYRHDYPIRPQHQHQYSSHDMPNLEFYLGLKPFLPNGVDITTFHEMWYGQYDLLESVHTYIQWLFPLQESGMNYHASPLTKEEIKEFHESTKAKRNLLISYKLMLDFYGIELCDDKTGEVKRASNWISRFDNLNSHTHNNLRITRILKCLGTLGYPHYQAPLVHFFLKETLVRRQLPNVRDSVLNYFVFAVLNKVERKKLIKFAYCYYDHKDEFVWCPKKIQMLWPRQGSRDNEHE
ncbi:opioid growth factor receptor-like [Parambassis ranga]|uniref:Opioid growth factor receptor-like n=1 Tax=Parambassis ranga TaxID=210632 RepID=A0A6P7I8F7_9TELE|nr:opioid growth factor receptor-like [Parambassis ranga]